MPELELNTATIARSTAVTLGAFLSLAGVQGLIQPSKAAHEFGFDDSDSLTPAKQGASARPNVWIQLTGARTLATGATALALAYRSKYNEVGIVYLYGLIIGATDTVLVYNQGRTAPAWRHAFGTGLFALVGGYLTFA